MYWLYIVFFQLRTMLNKLHYLKRDTEGSWIEQAKEMDLTCSERETSKAMKSEKLVPQPKIYVRQQNVQDYLCCQFALPVSALWRADFVLWVTLTCVAFGSLPNRSYNKISCPTDQSYPLTVVFHKVLLTVILNLWEFSPNVTWN